MSTPLTINSVETLQEALPIIRASQEAYGTYPWEIFKANYKVGDVVKATIVSITSFGALHRLLTV